MPRLFALLLIALLAAPAHADDMAPGSPACVSALAATDQTYDEASAALDQASASDSAAYCAALLHRAETIDATVAVYRQCLPDDANKEDGLAQLSRNADEFREMMIGEECPQP